MLSLVSGNTTKVNTITFGKNDQGYMRAPGGAIEDEIPLAKLSEDINFLVY